jgi:hypothetical protein
MKEPTVKRSRALKSLVFSGEVVGRAVLRDSKSEIKRKRVRERERERVRAKSGREADAKVAAESKV